MPGYIRPKYKIPMPNQNVEKKVKAVVSLKGEKEYIQKIRKMRKEVRKSRIEIEQLNRTLEETIKLLGQISLIRFQ